jgi:glycosyltransferase involved in cell wall biosynthesis
MNSSEPERPLRVLHLIDSLGMGGAEAWLVELLRYWRSQGGPVLNDFVATGGAPGVFDEEVRSLGAQIHYLRFGRGSLPAFAAGFRSVLRQGGYDAVHDHQDHASGWHYLLADGRLPPVRVTHVHNPAYQIRNNYGVTLRRRVTGRIGRSLVARYATHILGTSQESIPAFGFDEKMFRRTPKVALHCGLDPARFLAGDDIRASVREEFGWPSSAPVVLFAGRFDVSPDMGHPQNHKNAGFAATVAIAVADADAQVRFIFAGASSPATPVLRQRIEAAGHAERVAFAGVRKDIGRLMGAADALLFPSRAEGLGMVAVEAQAAGIPVLASTEVPRECVVIPELVTFLALDLGVVAWRDRLLALLRGGRLDPQAANARVAASPFSIDHSARILARVYEGGALA